MKKAILTIILIFVFLGLVQSAYAFDFTTPTLPDATPTLPPTEFPTELPTEFPTELPTDYMLELPSELDEETVLAYSPVDDANPPDAFDAAVVSVIDIGVIPLEADFMFEDGLPTMCYYAYDIITSGGDTVRVEREYLLTYCKQTYLSGEPVFITGSFSETSTGAAEGLLTGHVEGQLVMFDESAPDPSLVGKTLIALTHIPESYEGVQAPEQLVYTIVFLEPLDWFPGGTPTATPQVSPSATLSPTPTPRITPTPGSGGLFSSPTSSDDHHTYEPYSGGSEEDHHHDSGSGSGSRSSRSSSSSTDMPESSGPVQVAVGAIFVSIIAALSNLPSAALGSGMGAFASSAGAGGSSVSASTSAQGTVQSASVEAAGGGTSLSVSSGAAGGVHRPSGGISDILSAIGDFFKELIANLRDMLTDEGRSYASGKMSDLFEDDK